MGIYSVANKEYTHAVKDLPILFATILGSILQRTIRRLRQSFLLQTEADIYATFMIYYKNYINKLLFNEASTSLSSHNDLSNAAPQHIYKLAISNPIAPIRAAF